MGIDCKTDIYTIEQAVNEYNRLLDIKEDLARE